MKKFFRNNTFGLFIILLSLLLILLIIFYFSYSSINAKKQNLNVLINIANDNSVNFEKLYNNAFQLRHDRENYSNEIKSLYLKIRDNIDLLKQGGINKTYYYKRIKSLNNRNISIRLAELSRKWKEAEIIVEKITDIPVYISFASKESVNNTQIILNPSYENLLQKLDKTKSDLLQTNKIIADIYNTQFQKSKNNELIFFVVYFIFLLIYIIYLIYVFHKKIYKPLKNHYLNMYSYVYGEEKNNSDESDEIIDIRHVENIYNQLKEKLNHITEFVKRVGEGDFSAEIKNDYKSDLLIDELILMRDNFLKTEEENKLRKLEEQYRIWQNNGLAKFVEILRESNKGIKDLSNRLISNIIEYIKASQGAIFFYHEADNSENSYLELIAAYAYDRQKFVDQKVKIGEGLIGACYLERKSIYLTEIPDSYFIISSGMGFAKPKCLFITPLIHDDKVIGIMEIASFNYLKDYEIEFLEKLAENIATTLSTTAINEKTSQLLIKAQQQAETMQAQEEELRQNLEEMMATQEEAHKRNTELNEIHKAINSSIMVYELNTNGKYVHANDLFLKNFNLSLDELITISHFEITGESFKNYSAYNNFLSQLLKGNQLKKEIIYSLNGKKFVHEEFYNPIHNINEEVEKILVFSYKKITDVSKTDSNTEETEKLKREIETYRKSLEILEQQNEKLEKEKEKLSNDLLGMSQNLKNNELLFDEIFNASIDGIIELDNQGIIIKANNAFKLLSGKTLKELTERHISAIFDELSFINGFADISEIIDRFKNVISITLENQQGEIIPVLIKGIAFIISDKYHYLLIIRNNAEVTKLNDKIQKLKEEWENKEFELLSKINELINERKTLKEDSPEHLTEDIEKGFVVWYKKYNLNIPEIDEQHKRIIKLLNEFKQACDDGKSVNELNKLFKNLVNYTSYHFHNEESYFKKYAYKDADNHSIEHKKIIDIMQNIQNKLVNKEYLLTILEQLKDELINHFISIDVKYVHLFR
jgi:hemerythrin-like metal-binding protein/PAS domain S-box-containing protein